MYFMYISKLSKQVRIIITLIEERHVLPQMLRFLQAVLYLLDMNIQTYRIKTIIAAGLEMIGTTLRIRPE